MKDKKLPISLSQILLTVQDHDFVPTPSSLSALVFDRRHDFIIADHDPILAVRMVFANERCLDGDFSKGIRRKVSVSLINANNHNLVVTTSSTLNIRRCRFCQELIISLPINYDEIDFKHTYSVIVRDLKSGQYLGEQSLRFFNQFHYHTTITNILKPVSGGVEPDYTTMLHKSFDADVMSYHNVRFQLTPFDLLPLPIFLPEMEVRIHFPDGSVESSFVIPETDSDDEYDKFYYVSAPFFMCDAKKGICYAELICFDEAIAGFVFKTDGETIRGPWLDADMEILDEYSLEEATRRFKKSMDDDSDATSAEDDSTGMTDEDFEKALEEFIKVEDEPETPPDNDPEEAGASEIQQPEESAEEPQLPPAKEETLSPLKALENLTGLNNVKEKLLAYEKLVLFNKMRQESDLPTLNLPLHAMFLGSPGTGKTTVARRMGLMLHRAGMLSKGHVVVKERATLLGPYYSNEETNTLAAIEEARGGILFIDEAYQLYQPHDPKDPGKFVIEALMTALADESRRDWMLILAGYTDEMKRMFEMNPGLKSRIPDSNIYIFEDFSEAELMEIAERYLERHCYSMTDEAKDTLANRLGYDCRNRGRSFGNARHVINMIQSEILPSMASRVVASNNFDSTALSVIEASDIPRPSDLCRSKRPKIGYCA